MAFTEDEVKEYKVFEKTPTARILDFLFRVSFVAFILGGVWYLRFFLPLVSIPLWIIMWVIFCYFVQNNSWDNLVKEIEEKKTK